MFKINRTDKIDIDLYDSRINHTGFILFDKDMVSANTAYYSKHAETCYDLARMHMVYKSSNHARGMDRISILKYLTEYEHCPDRFFTNKKTKGFSLDTKRVLSVLYAKGFATEFLEYYMEYKSWGSRCDKLNTIIKECTKECGFARDGTRLYELPFNASVQTNLRFNYKDFDIISQIPKSIASCICVEDGYFLAWGDFAQSDLRIAYNLFLRTQENDKFFLEYEDKYEAIARMLANQNHEKFDPDKFKAERQIYKCNTLATVYGKRDSAMPDDAKFFKYFGEFVDKQPKYAAYRKLLETYCKLHLDIGIQSYFGFTQYVNTGYGVTKSTIEDRALNTPVQTGSSEIVIRVVNGILDKCYSMGYTDDDIRLYMTRHDEPIFRIKESAKDVLNILADHTTVVVDDWTPLRLDWNLGYRYKISDETLENEFLTRKKTNSETIVHPVATCDTNYLPLLPVLTLAIAKHATPDCRTIVTFYDDAHNEVMYSLLDSIDDEKVSVECKLKLRDAAKRITAAGFKRVIIFSDYLNGEDAFCDSSFTYIQVETNEALFSAKRLTDLMTWRYCKQHAFEPNVSSPVFTAFDTWINEVKDSHILIGKGETDE